MEAPQGLYGQEWPVQVPIEEADHHHGHEAQPDEQRLLERHLPAPACVAWLQPPPALHPREHEEARDAGGAGMLSSTGQGSSGR